MEKIKIAVVVDKEVPTDHSFIQGVLERELPGAQCEVTFIGYKSTLPIAPDPNVRFVTVAAGSQNFFLKKVHKLRHFTAKIKESGPYDVLYSRNDPVFLIAAAWLKRSKTIKLHFHQISHLHAFSKSDRSLLYRVKSFGDLTLRKFYLRYADRILLISSQMKSFLNAEWPEFSSRFLVFPLGVAVSDFADVKPIADRKFDVAYIGTLAQSRKIYTLIDSVALYNQKYGPLKLHIWGQSHRKQDDLDLHEYVVQKKLQQVVFFHGRIGRHEVLQNLKDTKIGLSAIPSDGILNQISPTKLMEYLAAGCCVIATSGIIDQEEIIGESYGRGALIGFTTEEICEAIHKLQSDPVHAQKLSEIGRHYIFAKRSYTEMASRLLSEIKMLLSK